MGQRVAQGGGEHGGGVGWVGGGSMRGGMGEARGEGGSLRDYGDEGLITCAVRYGVPAE